MSRLIGARSDFAVEYSPAGSPAAEARPWLFGTITVWIANHPIGRADEQTALTVVLGSLPALLQKSGTRGNERLFKRAATTAFDEIHRALYGDDGAATWTQLDAHAHTYDRYHALPTADVFDGWLAFMVEGERQDRFLVRRPDGDLLDLRANAGQHADVLRHLQAELLALASP